MSREADEFRRLADNAKARAKGRDEACRDVLLSVSEAYAAMARVREQLDLDARKYAALR
jgi:hypothetical protein